MREVTPSLGGGQVGAFRGKPSDKRLQGKERKVEALPDGERVVEIGFDLVRDCSCATARARLMHRTVAAHSGTWTDSANTASGAFVL